MTCTTPSHAEAIEEGQTCDIMDTIKTLDHGQDGCLLGKEKVTSGKTLASSIVQEALDQMRQVQGVREIGSTTFLKAQMYKDYRQHQLDDEPEVNGGKETEEQVQSFDPMQQEEAQNEEHDPKPTPLAAAISSIPRSKTTAKRSKRRETTGSSSSSSARSTSVIIHTSPPTPRQMIFSSSTSDFLDSATSSSSSRKFEYKNRRPASSRSTNLRRGPDTYFDGKGIYY
ncbi:hypothetical protein BCR42DRAFT_420511, partial [Absidia repens]